MKKTERIQFRTTKENKFFAKKNKGYISSELHDFLTKLKNKTEKRFKKL